MAYNLAEKQEQKRASLAATTALGIGGDRSALVPTRAYFGSRDESATTARNSERLSRLTVIPPVEPVAPLRTRSQNGERYGYDESGQYGRFRSS